MIVRARRAFPGMVMSILLSAPILSGPALAATPHTAKTSLATQRHPASGKVSRSGRSEVAHARVAETHANAAKTGVAKAGVTKTGAGHKPAARNVMSKAAARPRVIVPSGVSSHQVIRRTTSHGSLLIDDATLWRESGSSATWQQTGMASWYGGARWQGHRTTSGSQYDQRELTAAHATLPIGTRVKVTLNGSSRSVIVTINDRPGTRSRIIDLSRQAAAELGILERGTAMVTLSPL